MVHDSIPFLRLYYACSTGFLASLSGGSGVFVGDFMIFGGSATFAARASWFRSVLLDARGVGAGVGRGVRLFGLVGVFFRF